jgi:hypothetical protein
MTREAVPRWGATVDGSASQPSWCYGYYKQHPKLETMVSPLAEERPP